MQTTQGTESISRCLIELSSPCIARFLPMSSSLSALGWRILGNWPLKYRGDLYGLTFSSLPWRVKIALYGYILQLRMPLLLWILGERWSLCKRGRADERYREKASSGEFIWCPAGNNPAGSQNSIMFASSLIYALVSLLKGSWGSGSGVSGHIWPEFSYVSFINTLNNDDTNTLLYNYVLPFHHYVI